MFSIIIKSLVKINVQKSKYNSKTNTTKINMISTQTNKYYQHSLNLFENIN